MHTPHNGLHTVNKFGYRPHDFRTETKLPSFVCDTAAYGAWELSSPDSFGGGGRENPLAHRLSQAAQHRSVWICLFFQHKGPVPPPELCWSVPWTVGRGGRISTTLVTAHKMGKTIENTGAALAVHRWSRRCFSVGLTVASVGLAVTPPYQRQTKVHHRNGSLLQRPTPFQQSRVRS